MKELRYSRKEHWENYSDLRQMALAEGKEAALSPDRPEQYLGDAERGIASKLGWVYQGFIEDQRGRLRRSEEHTSELQSLMRISYAVFCLKKKKRNKTIKN